MTGNLIYRTAQEGKEYLNADFIVRAYLQNGELFNHGMLCADVIHTEENEKKIYSAVHKNPVKLAEHVADYVNELIRETHTIHCSNELPQHTPRFPNCSKLFRDSFVSEIDAETACARQARAMKQAQKERLDRIQKPVWDAHRASLIERILK